MTESTIYYFQSKTLKDGSHPVYLKITNNGNRHYLTLNMSCKKDEWNDKKKQFNSKHSDYDKANLELKRAKLKTDNIIDHFYKNDMLFVFSKFVEMYNGIGVTDKIISYFNVVIADLVEADKISTAGPYVTTRNKLIGFKNKNLKFADIDIVFLGKFESYLRKQGNKDTSIFVRMKDIRAVFNRAIKAKIISRKLYPFEDYEFGKLDLTTKKRAISKESVKEIEALKLDGKEQLAQSIFIFSYYTRGMNFIDIAALRWTDIISYVDNGKEINRIEFSRRKTKVKYSIKILPQAMEIINLYSELNVTNSDYVFPIYNPEVHTTEKKQYHKRYRSLAQINKILSETIAPMIGLNDFNLTTYVSRHTYANTLQSSGAAIEEIQRAMGHKNSDTTKIYLEEINYNDSIDDLDERAL